MEGPKTAPACRLDRVGLSKQFERYRQVSRHVETIEREPRRLVARLGPALPRGRLERALEVERACCPFISADYDPAGRLLTLTVEESGEDAALDALAEALTPPREA